MTKLAHVVLAAVVVTGMTGAQAKPDFSGNWAVVSPKEGVGQIQVVTQDEKTLSFYFASKGPDHRSVYQLDGVERRLPVPGQPSITRMARAAWETGRLIITLNDSYPSGAKIQTRDVWSIDAQGRLIIDSTEVGPSGPGLTTTITFVKKP